MDLGLTDKVALVTGSARGLGFASARALLAEGCRVCICARGQQGLDDAAAQLRREAGAGREDHVLAIQTDLSTQAGVETVVGQTVDTFGGLDVLVNNVGHAGGGGILEATDDDWQGALDQTLYPAIRASRLAVPHMRQRGGGVILIVARTRWLPAGNTGMSRGTTSQPCRTRSSWGVPSSGRTSVLGHRSSSASTSRPPCDASTSRKGTAGRLDRLGFQRSRTRCCSGP